jgi:glutathione S-transferase
MRLYDYGPSANCYKARLLLAQLARPYERVPIDIFGGDTLTDAFAEKNPARSTPVLETDDGRHVQESNAILWYLAEGTPFLPAETFERAHVLKWLIFEQTDVMPGIGGLRFRLLTKRWQPDEPDAVNRRELGRSALELLDDHLRKRAFLVAERYTIADIAVYAYTHTAPEAGFELGEHPAVAQWIARVESQPRFVDDLEPYPPNAERGAGSSVYG